MKTLQLFFLVAVSISTFYTSRLSGQTLSWVAKDTKGVVQGDINAMYSGNPLEIVCTITGVYFSFDYGNTWEERSSGITSKNVRCIIRTYNSILVGTWGGGVFKTQNYGITWTPANNGITETDVFSLNAFLHDKDTNFTIYAGVQSGDGGCFISTDEGETWHASNKGLAIPHIQSLLSIDGNTFLAGASDGIYKSTDGCANWTLKKEGFTTQCFASSGDTILAGTGSKGVYISYDRGETWTRKETGLRDNTIYDVKIFRNGNTLNGAVATQSGVYYTNDNCETWTSQNTGLPSSWAVTSLRFDSPNTLYCGISGGTSSSRLFWTEVPVGVSELNSQYFQSKIIPNPTSEDAEYQFHLDANSQVTVKVFDILGNCITVLADDYFEEGNHQLKIQSQVLPAGMYYVRIHTNTFSAAIPFFTIK